MLWHILCFRQHRHGGRGDGKGEKEKEKGSHIMAYPTDGSCRSGRARRRAPSAIRHHPPSADLSAEVSTKAEALATAEATRGRVPPLSESRQNLSVISAFCSRILPSLRRRAFPNRSRNSGLSRYEFSPRSLKSKQTRFVLHSLPLIILCAFCAFSRPKCLICIPQTINHLQSFQFPIPQNRLKK